MFFEIVTLSVVSVTFVYVSAYSIGMSEYAKLNNKHSVETELSRILDSLMTEKLEFETAVKERNVYESFLEFFDVAHCAAKYGLVLLLPKNTIAWPIIWIPMFFVFVPCGIKHG